MRETWQWSSKAERKKMMIRLEHGKKRQRASQQANQKKDERTTTKTHTQQWKRQRQFFFLFLSFSFGLLRRFSSLFFPCAYIYTRTRTRTHYICESNCPSLKILGQHFSLFSYWRKTYVTQIIRTHIHIIRKQRSRGTRGERIHVRNTDGYSRRLLSLTNASTHLPISNSIRYVNALEKKETFSSLV